jgi:hypothetical protein
LLKGHVEISSISSCAPRSDKNQLMRWKKAHFSRQIVVQILGMASPKVCGNLGIRPL